MCSQLQKLEEEEGEEEGKKIASYMTLPHAVSTDAEVPQPFSSSSSSPVDPQGPRFRTALHASALCSSSAQAPCAVSTSSLCTRTALSLFLVFAFVRNVFSIFKCFVHLVFAPSFPKNVVLRDTSICWLPFAGAMGFPLDRGVPFVKCSIQNLHWYDQLTHASHDLQ